MIRNFVCKISKELAISKDPSAYKHVRECNCYSKLWCKNRSLVSNERRIDKLSNQESNKNDKENTS